jgi:hypothetical protein
MADETIHSSEAIAAAQQRLKTGRNDPCPCGSGKKYKKCCLTADEALVREETRRRQLVPVAAAPELPGQVFDPLRPAREVEKDKDLDLEALMSADDPSLFAEHTQPVDGAPSELDEKLKRIWDGFEALSNPSPEQINALLDQLFSLPPEATLWSEVLHTIAAHQPGLLPDLYRRIAANVPHTKESGMSFFYWAAMEEFERRGYEHLLPEVAAALRRFDVHNFDVEAVSHMQDLLLAAGLDAELLAVCEHYLPILREDEEVFKWVAEEQSHLIFEIRTGRLLEGGCGANASVEGIASSLLAGIEEDVCAEIANQLAAVIVGSAPPAAWTREEFEVTSKPVPKGTGPLPEHLRPTVTLLRVAQEAQQFDEVKPGCAFPALMKLASAPAERDKHGNLKKHMCNLLEFLRASSIDERIARNSRDLIGFNTPKVRVLLQAHELLLHSAARHELLPPIELERTQAELATLRSYLKARPPQD